MVDILEQISVYIQGFRDKEIITIISSVCEITLD